MLPKYFLLVPTALLNDMDLFMQISELTYVEKVEVDEELTLCHCNEMFILYHHESGDFWPALEFHPLHVKGTAMGEEEPEVETPLQKVEAIEQGKRLKQVHSALVGMLFAGGVPLDECFNGYDSQIAAARRWTKDQLQRHPRSMPTNYRS